MAGTRALHVTRRRGPLCVLLLCWALGAEAATDQMAPPDKAETRCSDRQYVKDGRWCAGCPPGKYAAQQCSFNAKTVCRQCPGNTFTEVCNYIKSCHSCRMCDHELGFEVDTACSATNNTKCKCKSGTHCEKTLLNDCMHCTQHTECLPGTEVTERGSMHSDTQCAPCKEGYYQSERSLEAHCRQHTDCHSQGLQIVTPGSVISDSVCSNALFTTTPPTDRITGEHESTRMTLIIIFGTVILISIALFLMVILIRTPSVCKEIGKFFHRADLRAEPTDKPTHTEPLMAALTERRNPMEDPMLHRNIAAGCNLEQPLVVVESEHLQQNPPSVGQGGGPYLQETGPTSPSLGPCPSPNQEVLSGESNTTENLKTTQEGTASSDVTYFSAGPNNGVLIQGTKVTYNGNIYIYQTPTMPLVATGGSAPAVQVTLDPNDIPTCIPEQETPPPPVSMGQAPLPFCHGPAAGWHCIAPQQEEGKDLHQATEESLMDSMCPVEMEGSLFVDYDSRTRFGQYKRGSPKGEPY